jgi:hypothetical protein
MARTVTTILSYGMGVESSAILLRWVMNPATRPCPLEDLIVITSQVGDEYTDTGRDVEAHILPLMCAHGIPYVWHERRSETDFPTREEFITIAPAAVETKARYGLDWFEGRWSALQLPLF